MDFHPAAQVLPQAATFPYPLACTDGRRALHDLSRYRASPNSTPVILGSAFDVQEICSRATERRRAPTDILSIAAAYKHPDALRAHQEARHQENLAFLRAEGFDAAFLGTKTRYPADTDEGPWPVHPMPGWSTPTCLHDPGTDAPASEVFVTLIPTGDLTEAPAFLDDEGGDERPPAEYLVPALRDWRDRFGARLVAMTKDTLELSVTRPPSDRNAALALAREFQTICPDSVAQGALTVSNLAATLMNSPYWYLWWD